MSDYNSSLPIRTETAGDVAVKVVDSLGVNQLKIETNGSINTNTTISATNLDIRDLVFATDKVDVTGSQVSLDSTTLAALENITVSASNLDIRDLVFATDKVDASGSSVSITGTPTVDISASSLAALESITVQNGAGAAAVNIQDGGNSITVDATNLDIRDLAFATDTVNVTGSSVSITGTPVVDLSASTLAALESITVTVAPSAGIADYNTAANVAAAGSSSHTYTSTGNFYLTGVVATGSGKAKIVVEVNGAPKAVQFNSTANPNMSVEFKKPLLVTTGQTVVITRTNRDNQVQDLFSTVMGFLA